MEGHNSAESDFPAKDLLMPMDTDGDKIVKWAIPTFKSFSSKEQVRVIKSLKKVGTELLRNLEEGTPTEMEYNPRLRQYKHRAINLS